MMGGDRGISMRVSGHSSSDVDDMLDDLDTLPAVIRFPTRTATTSRCGFLVLPLRGSSPIGPEEPENDDWIAEAYERQYRLRHEPDTLITMEGR